MLNQALEAAYTQILSSPEAAHLQDAAAQAGHNKGLSGIFLSAVSEQYATAKHKVMVIGAETAGWNPVKRSQAIDDDVAGLAWPQAYAKRAMYAQQQLLNHCLDQKNRDRGHTFMNYMRDVAQVAGRDGLIYSNLFCFDWRKGSPIRSPHFEQVKALSKQVLDAQIRVLQPDYIVFANGISSAKYRREFFPVNDGGRCGQPVSHLDIAPTHYLWEFKLDERIRCFRVHHPAARSKEAKAGRQGAVKLLGAALAA